MPLFGGKALILKVGADLAGFDRKMATLEGKSKKLGGWLSDPLKAGKIAAVAFGASAVAAVTAIGISALSMSRQFDKAFAEVRTIIDMTRWDLKGAQLDIKKLATAYGEDLVRATQGLYQVVSRGFTEQAQATKVLESSMVLAKAGLSDTETAVTGVTAALRSWGVETYSAERVADIFAKGIEIGGTKLAGYANNLGKVSDLAAQMGLSLEEVVGAVAVLTAKGLSAEEAFTGIRQVIQGIINPSSEAAKLAKEMGLEFSASALKSQGLVNFLSDLDEASEKYAFEHGKELIDVMTDLFGSVESLGKVLSLGGENLGDYAKAVDDLYKAFGSAKRMQDEYAKSAEGMRERASAAWQAWLKEIGDEILPAYSGFMEGFAKATRKSLEEEGGIKPALALSAKEWEKYGENIKKTLDIALGVIIGFVGEAVMWLSRIAEISIPWLTGQPMENIWEFEGTPGKYKWNPKTKSYDLIPGTGGDEYKEQTEWYQFGGYVPETTRAIVHGGEEVMNPGAVSIFRPLLEAMNAIGLGSPAPVPSYDYSNFNVHLNFTGSVDRETVRRVIVPELQRAYEVGSIKRNRSTR